MLGEKEGYSNPQVFDCLGFLFEQLVMPFT